jgi:hypothetical protein
MLQLFTVFAFFAAGFFFTCLPFSTQLRLSLSDKLAQRPELCTFTGLCFFGLAFLFALGFYAATRGRYLLLNLGSNTVRVDSKILHTTIVGLFEKQFSTAIRLSDVDIVREKHLELRVFVEPMEEKEQVKFLAEVERHLVILLFERFGYRNRFTMQILKP